MRKLNEFLTNIVEKLNELLTNIVEKILKKIRWQNTKFNQQIIITILGFAFGCSLILILYLLNEITNLRIIKSNVLL